MTTQPKIGCCGFPVPQSRYVDLFPVVEVQTTFYQPPQVTTLQRWRAQVPPTFEFTLKAWQLVTHLATSPTYRRLKVELTKKKLKQCGGFQATPMVQMAWETSLACAEALGARVLLFQCPASFTPTNKNIRQLRRFFSSIDRHGLTLSWEPRGEWPESLVLLLCRELELVHAVDPFLCQSVTPEFIYYRLHGGKDFRHVFTDEELCVLARRVALGKPGYVLFNNRTMLSDASRFREIVERPDRGPG